MEHTCVVDRITSVIGGEVDHKFVAHDGDLIVMETAPGCWGPMITPCIYGGHEITGPVWLEDAVPGDAVAMTIEKVEILATATATGTGRVIPGRFDRDPSVKAVCPNCHTANPETYLEGTGENAIRCKKCGAPVLPQTFENGYTVAYSDKDRLAVAVDQETAHKIAVQTLEGKIYLPPNAKQHLATILERADFSGLPIRCRPMVGNIGCVPAAKAPASKNAGDYYLSIDKTGLFEKLSKEQINDAHMDIKSVGEGCVVISPVLVPGAGIYVGDVHLTQGDGEIAGHTLDISARVTFRVKLLKNFNAQGPILIPAKCELDSRFVPFTAEEYEAANRILQAYGKKLESRSWPIQFVGSGSNMNEGMENAFDRAENMTGLSRGELMNRATTGGEIGIGRTSGLVYLTITLEEKTLMKMGILELVRSHYN